MAFKKGQMPHLHQMSGQNYIMYTITLRTQSTKRENFHTAIKFNSNWRAEVNTVSLRTISIVTCYCHRSTVPTRHCPHKALSPQGTVLTRHCPHKALSSQGTVLTRHCPHKALSPQGTVLTRHCPHKALSSQGTVLTRHCPHKALSSQEQTPKVPVLYCCHY